MNKQRSLLLAGIPDVTWDALMSELSEVREAEIADLTHPNVTDSARAHAAGSVHAIMAMRDHLSNLREEGKKAIYGNENDSAG